MRLGVEAGALMGAGTMAVNPFRIDVPQPVLDDLTERLARTRWPLSLRTNVDRTPHRREVRQPRAYFTGVVGGVAGALPSGDGVHRTSPEGGQLQPGSPVVGAPRQDGRQREGQQFIVGPVDAGGHWG